ncbi:MFS transporter [Streptomyces sp. MZ04]|nr:MFS transporter [Streptomyces sp. MZ04]
MLAIALGIFALMTSELLPVGLLTPIGSELEVSAGTAGLMVTVPGLLAAVSAPTITVLAARLDRRTLLVALTSLMAAANLVSAIAPTFPVILLARLAIGVSVGGFWAVAGGLAVRLVPEHGVARATAIIFGGVSTASVVGVPAGTLLGDTVGWRAAFATVGVLGLIAAAALRALVPPLPPGEPVTIKTLPALLRGNRGVRTGLLITTLLITGHFAAYTFVRPLLQETSNITGGTTGLLLMAYGIAGITGNFLAGSRVRNHVRETLLTVALAIASTLALLAVPGQGPVTGTLLLAVWGLAYGAVSVSLQTWMLQAAPNAAAAASALFVSAFNLSIALGALLGGLAADGLATRAVLGVGGVLALLTALTVAAGTPATTRTHH